jgi:hypothetical protein
MAAQSTPPASDTPARFDAAIARCRAVFVQKGRDYGPSWTIARPQSLTDQIFIKARRIRQIEESGENHVGDSLESDLVGIANYALMARILLPEANRTAFAEAAYHPTLDSQLILYDAHAAEARALMLKKNADYGEAWRDLRPESLTDLLLMRLLRIRQIEDQGPSTTSEGLDAQLLDLFNYALFALLRREMP